MYGNRWLSPYSHLSQGHKECREGEEEDSDRRSQGLQEEAGCSLAPLGKSIHQTTCQGHVFSWGTTNKWSYITLSAAQAACGGVCDGERCTCQLPHLCDQSINRSLNQSNQSPTILLLFQLHPQPSIPAGHSLRQGSDRTYPHQSFSLDSGSASPHFWPRTITAALIGHPGHLAPSPQAPDSPSLGEVMVLTLILSLQTSWWHCL